MPVEDGFNLGEIGEVAESKRAMFDPQPVPMAVAGNGRPHLFDAVFTAAGADQLYAGSRPRRSTSVVTPALGAKGGRRARTPALSLQGAT
jgi:hypothetical protein